LGMWTYSDLVATSEERSAMAAVCERAVRVITTRLEVPKDKHSLGSRVHERDGRERSVTRDLHVFVRDRDLVIRVRCARDDSGGRTLSIRRGTNLASDAPWRDIIIKDFSDGEERAIVEAAFAEAVAVLEEGAD